MPDSSQASSRAWAAPSPYRRRALLLVWITPALWSSNYLIARMAHGVVAPHALAFGRWAFALLLILPWVWQDRRQLLTVWRREWRRMVLLGALGMWVCGAFVYIGGASTSATNIGLIYATAPVGIAFLGRRLLQERVSRAQSAGMALALAGVLWVVARGDLRVLWQARFVAGDLWILAAAICWVLFSVLQQRWPCELGPRQRLACITVGGLAVLLPFTVLEALWSRGMPPLSLQALGWMALAGLLPGFLSYQAYALMLRELGAAGAGMVLYLSPLYGAVLAWWFLGEAPHVYHAVGAALILPSIALATRTSRRTGPAPAPADATACGGTKGALR